MNSCDIDAVLGVKLELSGFFFGSFSRSTFLHIQIIRYPCLVIFAHDSFLQ